jgi:hypothetical protein
VNQQELMMRVLQEAGGQAVETAMPDGYKGAVADILFPEDDVIVEIKSLTADRSSDPKVMEAIGQMLAENWDRGGAVVVGEMSVRLDSLERPIAANALRIVGQSVQNKARKASRQLAATKNALRRPNAVGVIVLITPPFKLGRNSIQWLFGDSFREGGCSSIDVVFLVQTPIGAPSGMQALKDSFLSFHSRPDRPPREVPERIVRAIDRSWGQTTGQLGRNVDSDDFEKFGAIT